jgi:four helix bundle protein
MKTYFDHEKLEVYQFALSFYEWAEPILGRVPKSHTLHDQLDRAKTSVVLNIPEGNGKFTSKDRCRFFDNSRGSALECAACLDLMRIKKFLSDSEVDEGKDRLRRIVSMLVGLIRSNSDDRLYEDVAEYRTEGED